MNLPMNKRRNNRQKKVKFPRKRILPLVMPSVWYCSHRYISNIIGATSTNIYLAEDWYINTIQAPEVSGTDTSDAIGFFQLIQIYGNYLVQGVKFDLEICNEEDFEINVVMAPSINRLKPDITSGLKALQLGEMPWGKGIILGRNSGQNRGRMTISLPNARLTGNHKIYNGDLAFIGTSSQPEAKQYMTFAAVALSSNVLTNGVTFKVTVTYKVKWSLRIFEDIDTEENDEIKSSETKLRKIDERERKKDDTKMEEIK